MIAGAEDPATLSGLCQPMLSPWWMELGRQASVEDVVVVPIVIDGKGFEVEICGFSSTGRSRYWYLESSGWV